jgi:hypothetical protein
MGVTLTVDPLPNSDFPNHVSDAPITIVSQAPPRTIGLGAIVSKGNRCAQVNERSNVSVEGLFDRELPAVIRGGSREPLDEPTYARICGPIPAKKARAVAPWFLSLADPVGRRFYRSSAGVRASEAGCRHFQHDSDASVPSNSGVASAFIFRPETHTFVGPTRVFGVQGPAQSGPLCVKPKIQAGDFGQ